MFAASSAPIVVNDATLLNTLITMVLVFAGMVVVLYGIIRVFDAVVEVRSSLGARVIGPALMCVGLVVGGVGVSRISDTHWWGEAADAAAAHWELEWVTEPTATGATSFTAGAEVDGQMVDCVVAARAGTDELVVMCDDAAGRTPPPVRAS